MIPLEGFDIRYSTEEDLPFLETCFEEANVCDYFPFSEREKKDALKNWIGFAKYKAGLVGLINDKPCAIGTLLLMPYRKVAHHGSFYLIVDPKHRKKGIGESMVKNLLHLARTRFRLESVHVELYEPSPIRSLLLKMGFQQFVRQENFVKLQGQPRARLLLEYRFS